VSTFAVILIAVAAGDLVHGLTGEPRTPKAVVLATLVAVIVGGLGAALTGQDTVAFIGVLGLSTAIVVGWQELRRREVPAAWPLAHLGVGLAVAVVFDSRVDYADGGQWRWIWEDLRIPALQSTGDERALVVIGLALVLVATANSVVRLVLALEGVRVHDAPDDSVKGGRVIGPIERLVIFGSLIAGAPTIAGFVVAAKSLLRFPELNQKSRIHETTEYVVIGSLASWGLALCAAVLGAGPG
jgi:hypothetical protein